MSHLCHSPVPPIPQSNQEQSLQQKLLDEQFSILQETVREAEDILRDAVSKLDDPLHVRCTSSPGISCLTHTVPSSSRMDNVASQHAPGTFSCRTSHPGRLGADFPGRNCWISAQFCSGFSAVCQLGS